MRESERIEEISKELVCEEAIIEEKSRFGRVRNSFMKSLRRQYGHVAARRALWRVNRRLRYGYLIGSDREKAEGKATEVLSRLVDKEKLVERDDRKAEAERVELEEWKERMWNKAEEARKEAERKAEVEKGHLKPLNLR